MSENKCFYKLALVCSELVSYNCIVCPVVYFHIESDTWVIKETNNRILYIILLLCSRACIYNAKLDTITVS